jgi:hypothetical protein
MENFFSPQVLLLRDSSGEKTKKKVASSKKSKEKLKICCHNSGHLLQLYLDFTAEKMAKE